MQIDVLVADASHVTYADEICEEILVSARERGTGIARRTPEYIIDKMLAGKAVIAVAEDGRFAGFSYIETWEANSMWPTPASSSPTDSEDSAWR